MRFSRGGNFDENAGFDFIKFAKREIPDLPMLVQSSEQNVRERAYEVGASFIDKNSESLEMELAAFLQANLGFGNFVFRNPDGNEITRARNMGEFVEKLNEIPIESLLYHAEHNHFSAWLMARGEIHVAKILRPYRITDFSGPSELRQFIVHLIDQIRSTRSRGMVPYFDPEMIKYPRYLCKIADGSVGGKGRGLIFIHSLLDNIDFSQYLKGIHIAMPNTVFVGIDEFEHFLEMNGLWSWAYYGNNTEAIPSVFIQKALTPQLVERLRQFISVSKKPLAVRSSGLFEDMLMVPFSGVYDTYIIPNNHPDPEIRLQQLCSAIKLIYASLFSKEARAYFEAANYNLEEERMAVVIQELVGSPHDSYFYPNAAGVAQSYNYYPVSYVKPDDGLCLAALGLGTYVVGGGAAYRFCPKYPKLDVLSPEHALESTQRTFHALSLENRQPDLLQGEMASLSELSVSTAEKDRYFPMIASTWDAADQRFVPGILTKGHRVIDFANMLKYEAYPFAQAIDMVLDIATRSMGTPVEIEYAFNFDVPGQDPTLYLLQLKPLIHIDDRVEIDPTQIRREDCLMLSRNCMGNGRDFSVQAIVWVDPRVFERDSTLEIAAEIEELDTIARKENFNYLLIGPGRWGTRDRWLGIPVSYAQISRAKAIAEVDLPDFVVESSQGSHFFHNLTTMRIKYMKVTQSSAEDFMNWSWLYSIPPRMRTRHCALTMFDSPMDIRFDGRTGIGAILKPSAPMPETES